MNNPFPIIIAASRKHPWLLVILLLAVLFHCADLQWPELHKFFSTAAHAFFAVAAIYASGTSLPPSDPSSLPPKSNPSPPGPGVDSKS